MPLLVAPLVLVFGLSFVFLFQLDQEKDNAEFEAKHCPEMLQVESKFCKPLEDD